ncbi:hypothetical protein CMI37_14310 [Candidatus Pacearchaeota archaeon]|nr:hypothetical protein [Candidatus Pacearchaeota archaeon]|tara:strand:+ start:516 stop:851 length:336 start_codon:yes stop_codon:yes gene_type:complete
MIYLASPYSDPDPAVRQQRFDAVCRHAAEMMRSGDHVFSPIAHTHPIATYGLPGDWQFWEAFDRQFIELCDEVCVLMLDGWRQSEGLQAEIRIALEMGMPVRYLVANKDKP